MLPGFQKQLEQIKCLLNCTELGEKFLKNLLKTKNKEKFKCLVDVNMVFNRVKTLI